eukprot:TRINITY_DN1518_c0_g1_i2.p1 TRINITY_DN1518_c0_g1~~TRINITY_DN1518_c0_g1_i2.p1  ORF type:complete len:180 (-),score=23.62 TRINITY_DN1518_c0_g1_i2:45-563(-)
MADREPCPWRVPEDIGSAFAFGAVGGTVWYTLKGLKTCASGERLIGTARLVRRSVPRTSGAFGVWGGLFSAFDCTYAYIRQKEDSWNAILSGATTGTVLAMRSGASMALKSGLFGGLILAMIEGLSIAMNRQSAPPPAPGMQMQQAPPPAAPPRVMPIRKQAPNVSSEFDDE